MSAEPGGGDDAFLRALDGWCPDWWEAAQTGSGVRSPAITVLRDLARSGAQLASTAFVHASAFELSLASLPRGHDLASLLKDAKRSRTIERAARAFERVTHVGLPEPLVEALNAWSGGGSARFGLGLVPLREIQSVTNEVLWPAKVAGEAELPSAIVETFAQVFQPEALLALRKWRDHELAFGVTVSRLGLGSRALDLFISPSSPDGLVLGAAVPIAPRVRLVLGRAVERVRALSQWGCLRAAVTEEDCVFWGFVPHYQFEIPPGAVHLGELEGSPGPSAALTLGLRRVKSERALARALGWSKSAAEECVHVHRGLIHYRSEVVRQLTKRVGPPAAWHMLFGAAPASSDASAQPPRSSALPRWLWATRQASVVVEDLDEESRKRRRWLAELDLGILPDDGLQTTLLELRALLEQIALERMRARLRIAESVAYTMQLLPGIGQARVLFALGGGQVQGLDAETHGVEGLTSAASRGRARSDRALAELEAAAGAVRRLALVNVVQIGRAAVTQVQRLSRLLRGAEEALLDVAAEAERRLRRLDASLATGDVRHLRFGELVSALAHTRADFGPLIRLRRSALGYQRSKGGDGVFLDAASPLPSAGVEGRGLAPGLASGVVRHVGSVADAACVDTTDVVVAAELSAEWLLPCARAAAWALESGSELSDVALWARRFGVPTVSGVHALTVRVTRKQELLVDGDRGRITPGPNAFERSG